MELFLTSDGLVTETIDEFLKTLNEKPKTIPQSLSFSFASSSLFNKQNFFQI